MVGAAIKNENSYSWLTIFYVDAETGKIIFSNGYLSNILSVLMENYEPEEEYNGSNDYKVKIEFLYKGNFG